MKFNTGITVFLIFAGVLFTAVTFFLPQEVDRRLVQKEFPPYEEATVQGRGWPFSFIADNPAKPNYSHIGPEDTILLGRLLGDIACNTLLLTAIYSLMAFLRTSSPKKQP